MLLRQAEPQDMEKLFLWRNDPTTRLSSIHTEPIAWDDHVRWFQRSLHSEKIRLFIAEKDGQPVGTCRIDHKDGYAMLSWTVAPEHRKKGFGTYMVKRLLEEQALQHMTVQAEIKEENIASIRIAKACGFQAISERLWQRENK